MLKFNEFLIERLSYSEDVEIISKSVIEYLYDKENWESEEVIKIDNPVIKEDGFEVIKRILGNPDLTMEKVKNKVWIKTFESFRKTK
jgi:hypothetical protein